jgi:ADP-dependent phosphofructokinase/glucokinase
MGRIQTLLQIYNERLQSILDAYNTRTKAMMDLHSERVQTLLDINNDPEVLNNGRLCEAISVVIQELYNIKRKGDNSLLGGLKDE